MLHPIRYGRLGHISVHEGIVSTACEPLLSDSAVSRWDNGLPSLVGVRFEGFLHRKLSPLPHAASASNIIPHVDSS
jgi:hypothetical protein